MVEMQTWVSQGRRGLEPLDVVEFGEIAVVVVRLVGHEFLLGLLAEVLGIDQEEDALSLRVFEQAVDGGDRGEGLARTGGHLDQRAGPVFLEGRFQVGDRLVLAIAQAQFLAELVRMSPAMCCNPARNGSPCDSLPSSFPGGENEHLARRGLGSRPSVKRVMMPVLS